MVFSRIKKAVFPNEEAQMSFLEHLGELRNRLLYSTFAIVVCACLGFVYAREIIQFLMGPLKQATQGLDILPDLHFTSLTEPLFQSFKIALFAGLFLAFPFWIFQIWKFVAPGLVAREKKYATPFILSATCLFLVGASFAYYFAVPTAYRVLLLYARPQAKTIPAPAKKEQGLILNMTPTVIGKALRSVQTPSSRPSTRKTNKTKAPTKANTTTTKSAGDKEVASTQKDYLRVTLKLKRHPDPTQGWQLKLLTPDLPPLTPQKGKTVDLELLLRSLLDKKGIDFQLGNGQQQQRFVFRYQWQGAKGKSKGTNDGLKPILTLKDYLSVSSWFLLGFGLIFQTPLVIFLLVLLRLVTPEWLGRYRRHAFVAILTISAVLTPTGDPLNLMIMAIPMYILFEIGLLVSRLVLSNQDDDDDDDPSDGHNDGGRGNDGHDGGNDGHDGGNDASGNDASGNDESKPTSLSSHESSPSEVSPLPASIQGITEAALPSEEAVSKAPTAPELTPIPDTEEAAASMDEETAQTQSEPDDPDFASLQETSEVEFEPVLGDHALWPIGDDEEDDDETDESGESQTKATDKDKGDDTETSVIDSPSDESTATEKSESDAEAFTLPEVRPPEGGVVARGGGTAQTPSSETEESSKTSDKDQTANAVKNSTSAADSATDQAAGAEGTPSPRDSEAEEKKRG